MFYRKLGIYFFCVIFPFLLMGAGCKSAPIGGYTDQSVLEHQARIIELENRNASLEERIGQYDQLTDRTVSKLEAVGRRADGIADAAERIDYLFGEYERAVQQLVHELRNLERDVREVEEIQLDPFLDIGRLDGP